MIVHTIACPHDCLACINNIMAGLSKETAIKVSCPNCDTPGVTDMSRFNRNKNPYCFGCHDWFQYQYTMGMWYEWSNGYYDNLENPEIIYNIKQQYLGQKIPLEDYGPRGW